MTSKIIGVLIGIIVLLMLSVCIVCKQNRQLAKERDKYQNNSNALLSSVKRLQIDSSTMALDTKALKLTIDEYKQYRSEDAEMIKKLNLHIGSLQSVAKHNVEVNADIQAHVRDTMVLRDTTIIRIQSVQMETPHLKITGVIENDLLTGRIHLPVNLHQAVWVEHKHRFLWWRWGVKAIHQTISSDNPHVEIKYSEMIMIEK